MRNIIPILFITLLNSCGTNSDNSNQQTISVDSKSFLETVKFSEGDPFIETIKKSEFFKLSGLTDKVVETNNGTIISIPKGAFRDSKGKIVEKEITIEITDIASFEEQFKSNISSPSGQNLMLNGGALYINATSNGSQLSLNDDSPIYVETKQKSNPKLIVFEGVRNDQGEMQWLNPKQPKKYLIPVNLNELDFLPKGFANEVEKNIPFGNYLLSSKELVDSLYYSLAAEPVVELDIEAEENQIESINAYSSNYEIYSDSLVDVPEINYCSAINPASIKVIKGKKFLKSFIATKQFEERLQTIHRTRKQDILEIYINNLSKNLSYCDSLVANSFNVGSSFELKFRKYAKENWSNLENLPRSVQRLGEYYTTNLKKVEETLQSSKKAYKEALAEKSAEAEKIKKGYRILLTKRQNYRQKKHGFTLGKLGWIASGIVIEPFTININVKTGADYDRVHVYTIDPSIKSIFAWQSADMVNFNYAFAEDVLLVYKKSLQAKALVVAYKNDTIFSDIQDFRAENHVEINFTLNTTTKNELSRMLKHFDRGSKDFNKLKVDLEYQASFYKEKERLKKVINQRKVITYLKQFIYQCNSK